MTSPRAVGARLPTGPRADWLLALLITIGVLTASWLVGLGEPGRRPLDAPGFGLLAVAGGALGLRRRSPGSVLIVIKCVTLAYLLLGYPKGPCFIPMLIAFFSAVLEGQRPVAWGVLAVEYATFPTVPAMFGVEPPPTIERMVGLAGWLLMLGACAEWIVYRRARRARLREEARRQLAEQQRLRVAADLHDALGHNISLISVQAGMALHLMDRQPGRAAEALAVIRDASRDALGELRVALDVLRTPGAAGAARHAASMSRLDVLVARAADAGLQVKTSITGSLGGLPNEVDATAFRIVQESLTNVLRHSGQLETHIRIERDADALSLQIDNAIAREPASTGRGDAGVGIAGMRERAAALGGVFEATAQAGNFRVRARLPLAHPAEGAA